MAARYIEELLAARPEGPYHLGGWSMGGLVAFEMARRLTASGLRVSTLTLIDSVEPALGREVLRAGETDEAALLLSLAGHYGLLQGQAQRATADCLRGPGGDEGLTRLLELASAGGAFTPDVDLRTLRRLFEVFKANARAAWSYAPPAYEGAVTLYRASERLWDLGADATLGWGRVAPGGVESFDAPGNHYTVLSGTQAPALARMLAPRLALSEGGEVA